MYCFNSINNLAAHRKTIVARWNALTYRRPRFAKNTYSVKFSSAQLSGRKLICPGDREKLRFLQSTQDYIKAVNGGCKINKFNPYQTTLPWCQCSFCFKLENRDLSFARNYSRSYSDQEVQDPLLENKKFLEKAYLIIMYLFSLIVLIIFYFLRKKNLKNREKIEALMPTFNK